MAVNFVSNFFVRWPCNIFGMIVYILSQYTVTYLLTYLLTYYAANLADIQHASAAQSLAERRDWRALSA